MTDETLANAVAILKGFGHVELADKLERKYGERAVTLDEAIASIPETWTWWELRSSGRRTRHTFTLERLVDPHDLTETEQAIGRGPTPVEAVLAALRDAEPVVSSPS